MRTVSPAFSICASAREENRQWLGLLGARSSVPSEEDGGGLSSGNQLGSRVTPSALNPGPPTSAAWRRPWPPRPREWWREETGRWRDECGKPTCPITAGLPRLAFGSRPSGTGLWPVRQPADVMRSRGRHPSRARLGGLTPSANRRKEGPRPTPVSLASLELSMGLLWGPCGSRQRGL